MGRIVSGVGQRADNRARQPRGLTVGAIVVSSLLLAACAGAGAGGGLGAAYQIAGDEKGGKIVGGVRDGDTKIAMQSVTAHCEKYGKRAFVTQMESPAQGGALGFVCLNR